MMKIKMKLYLIINNNSNNNNNDLNNNNLNNDNSLNGKFKEKELLLHQPYTDFIMTKQVLLLMMIKINY